MPLLQALSRATLTLLVVIFAAGSAAQTSRSYYPEPAYADWENNWRNQSSPEAVCQAWFNWYGWAQQGNISWNMVAEAPGRWRCQRLVNGAVDPGYRTFVYGQCQKNPLPAQFLYGRSYTNPYWDENISDCYCQAPFGFDASIQWCVPNAAEPPVYREESCGVGNPVQPGTGTKRHIETDYLGVGAHPVGIQRAYRSDSVTANSLANLEIGWMHSYQARLVLNPYGDGNPIVAIRPDANLTRFVSSSTGVPRTWQSESGTVRDQLVEVRDAAGALTGWRYTSADDDSAETYDASGRLLSIQARNGWVTTLAYSTATTPYATAPAAGLLISAKNHFGRELRFVYNAQSRLSELLVPGAVAGSAAGSAASPIRYVYSETVSLGSGVADQGQLTSVIWQDGAVRRYHYEDNRHPNALTGITDEAGVRYATYSYDTYRRVVGEEHAGGADRIEFSYGSNQTTVTDYSGAGGAATQRTYSFVNQGGVLRPTAVSAPCPLCGNTQQSSSYDASGKLSKAIAHDGTVLFYAYDAKGRETERATFAGSYSTATTRPALANATQVISTRWHATFNLPTQIAEPNKTTANTYNSKGMLTGQSWTATTDNTGVAKFTAVKTGSTYATGWGYNANGLNTSVVEKTDSVETQRWTISYDALGNLTRITDVTGGNLIGRATQYDAHGRLLTGTTTFGLPVGYGYSPRGYVRTRSVSGQTTTFTQNPIGLTTDVLLPDNQTVRFEYDATHRLNAVRLNGALLTASAMKDGGRSEARLAIARERLQQLVESMVRSAHAQVPIPIGPTAPGSVAPGIGLPGQFGAGTADILTANDYPGERAGGKGLPLFGPQDEAMRRLLQAVTRFCQCDPSGGFAQPKLTAQALAHIVVSGHTGPAFANKSYFTEPVNQALVDEVVSKNTRPDVPGTSKRAYFVSDMGRPVGFVRRPDGTFAPERGVTLVVHKDNCSSLFFVRNEVITMYPGR